MVFTLLLLGAYAASKGAKAYDNKTAWEKVVADYNLERDFEKVLFLCGPGEGQVNWLGKRPEINKTTINNCIKNLRTIPYLDDKDILDFEIKAWGTKLKELERERNVLKEQSEKELKQMEAEIKGLPTQRRTYNRFTTSFLLGDEKYRLYKLYTQTIWGEIAYNPKFDKWLENEDENLSVIDINRADQKWLNMPSPCGFTDKYEVWVVDAPIPSDLNKIYTICNNFVKNDEETTEEKEISSRIFTMKNIKEKRY